MLKPTRTADLHPILPRPMAVYRYLPATDEFEIVYRVIGTGTRAMSERTAGEVADAWAPSASLSAWPIRSTACS